MVFNLSLLFVEAWRVTTLQFTNILHFQGAVPSVPKYLRFEARFEIARLWCEKAALDAESEEGSREDMNEFLYTYLQRRFGIEQMIYEWSYNLHDACQRYSHDQKIGLSSPTYCISKEALLF